MDIELKNARFVQPSVEETTLTVKKMVSSIPREAHVIEEEHLSPVDHILFTSPMTDKTWVEIYINGFRLINASLDFGRTFEDFDVLSDRVVFKTPQSGKIKIILDTKPNMLIMPPENYVQVSNRQGAKSKAVRPGDLYVAYFCEPLILTEPLNGYVRLTDDRQSLLYIPNQGFEGYDAFSFSVFTERGQLATPKCVNVKVGSPKAPGSTGTPA